LKRLVLLGGGHAHLHVLQDFGARPDEAVSLTLVTPNASLIYTGMLPGMIAGHYTLDEASIDLVALAGRAHAAFVQTTGVLVNPDMREVICADGTVLPYDALSVDIGSQSHCAGVKGATRHAITVRPLEGLVAGFERVRDQAHRGAVRSVSIVGGGAGGVELAFAMDWRFRRELGDNAPHVRVVTDSADLMPEFAVEVRRRLRRKLRQRGIGTHEGSPAAEVGADYLRLASGLEFASEATFWAAGAGAPEIFRDSGFALAGRGFLSVNDRLQSRSHPEVFGAGDCASDESNPRPKAGVYAVRAGAPLTANLRAALGGAPLVPWSPQKRFLALISTGDRHAVGSWGLFGWQGDWAWNWKDRIDREFVARYAAPVAT
jgi:selenide,water dikinase